MQYIILAIFIIVFTIIYLMPHKCPKCGGKLHSEFFDMQFDKMVYRCDKCGKEYI